MLIANHTNYYIGEIILLGRLTKYLCIKSRISLAKRLDNSLNPATEWEFSILYLKFEFHFCFNTCIPLSDK